MSPEAGTSRYFILTDDKSNKFWQITVADASYTVAYGRVGTKGQSQQKTYNSAGQCRLEADKVIREKISKGYIEAEGIALDASQTVRKGRDNKADDANQQSPEVTLQAYQELIDRKEPAGLVAFLQSVDRAHYPALRKAIKTARKHYCEYVELEERKVPVNFSNRWGMRGTDEQRCIIKLSGLALLPAAELKPFNLMLYLNDAKQDELVDSILDWAKLTWLANYLLEDSRRNTWSMVAYPRLRQWEAKGYIEYLPELFARSIAECRTRTAFRDYAEAAQQYVNYLCEDEIACSRDFPLLFEYETNMHAANYALQPVANGPITQVSIWGSVINRVLKEDKLDRSWMLESCITVQSKDWNANLRSFYRKQVDAMAPTPDELLSNQHNLFQLLGAQHPHVVNWAVGWIKEVISLPAFDKAALLEWAPVVMMRSDCKTAVKSLLSLFEKGMKKGDRGNNEILAITADVFAQSDLSLQTKVAGLIRKYGKVNEALSNKLRLYSDQMLGTIRQELQDFIETDEAESSSEISSGRVTYTFAPARTPLLAEVKEVSLPQNWNDWLFAVGKYIGSDDVLDMEILINACILPPEDTLSDGEQLLPYTKQLAVATGSYIKTFTNNWLLQVLQNPAHPFNQQKTEGDYETLRLHVARLQHAQRKMQAKSTLPLLSFPSHEPYYIAPLILVERLLKYQEAGEQIDILDLTIALARTITDGADEAIQLAKQLDELLKNLITYALTGEGEPTPKKDGGLLKAIAKGLGLSKEKDSVYLEMAYITAARTRKPDAVFDSLSKSQFADRPNVVRPFIAAWQLKESWNEYIDWRTKEKTRTPSWRELLIELPEKKHAGSPLLYSNDLAAQDKTFHWWYGLLSSDYDVSWWYSIVPQMPEGLFTLLLKCGCQLNDLTAAGTSGLRLMLDRHFRFREMSSMLLACGLAAGKREDRGLAAEVLIQHMSTQSIDAIEIGKHIGALMREGYAPVQRLAESLQLIKDVSPVHNRALVMLTEEIILSFGLLTEPPKNTKKLLELYLNVLVKTNEKPGGEILPLLERWASGALKPIINSLNKLIEDGSNQ